jgi:hypothetical protein
MIFRKNIHLECLIWTWNFDKTKSVGLDNVSKTIFFYALPYDFPVLLTEYRNVIAVIWVANLFILLFSTLNNLMPHRTIDMHGFAAPLKIAFNTHPIFRPFTQVTFTSEIFPLYYPIQLSHVWAFSEAHFGRPFDTNYMDPFSIFKSTKNSFSFVAKLAVHYLSNWFWKKHKLASFTVPNILLIKRLLYEFSAVTSLVRHGQAKIANY